MLVALAFHADCVYTLRAISYSHHLKSRRYMGEVLVLFFILLYVMFAGMGH